MVAFSSQILNSDVKFLLIIDFQVTRVVSYKLLNSVLIIHHLINKVTMLMQ